MNFGLGHIVAARKPRPRGVTTEGPAILSYGFRPFFLLAGLFAFVAMASWIGVVTFGWTIGGSLGHLNWHAHEMLFGYTAAALAGFALTAIPNWTGRLPVSGLPLLGLVLVWIAGRMVMAIPDLVGTIPAAAIDASFIPVLAVVAGREIIAGRNWKNLKLLLGLLALSGANIAFHIAVALDGEASAVSRFTVGVYVVLVALVGGRLIPSFTRNWLTKAKSPVQPKSFGKFDAVAIAFLIPALLAWVFLNEEPASAVLALVAAALHAIRLWRWVGWHTAKEPLLLVMHVAYAFLPVGMLCVGLAELGLLSGTSALHVLTVGVLGGMTFAVMTRASLGHTGRPLSASRGISIAYVAIVLSAAVRPLADILTGQYHLLLVVAGVAWLIAFGLFIAEYGPMLVRPRMARQPVGESR